MPRDASAAANPRADPHDLRPWPEPRIQRRIHLEIAPLHADLGGESSNVALLDLATIGSMMMTMMMPRRRNAGLRGYEASRWMSRVLVFECAPWNDFHLE